MKNGIYLVATPIGNLGDISVRAKEVLAAADVIACEDTRVTKKLFSLLGLSLKKKFVTLQDHNEDQQLDQLLEMAASGLSVAQVSDAGSPLISDPGYKLAREARRRGIYLCTVPGPCALICALQLSGLPINSFMFAGFIPNKDKARRDLFNKLKDIETTLVFYETANRIIKTLTAAAQVFGNREMAVAREITKLYEECIDGTAEELLRHFETHEPKGEMVFMVAPPLPSQADSPDLENLLRQELAQHNLKTAVQNIVSRCGLKRNDVYHLALKIKDE